jgi:serine/threonine protein kinase
VARFIQEAQLAGQLSHPNIVHVHGMGVEQQIPYYAMDFVEGETLAQMLARLKETDEDAVTPFGRKGELAFYSNLASAFVAVADGLQHAHAKKVIHRDIKPSNLIIDRDGRLRILDFGLARREGQESLTVSGDLLGTPQYMSPEQARRKKIPVDHRTDIYSLGATLYEMLTLQPPFQGKDHQDTLSQIIERDPVEPTKLNTQVPRDLETIVLKCLRKEAVDRYGTAEAMGQDLRRFLRGDPIEARPQPRWETFARMAWREKACLDIEFIPRVGQPKISGIEIERLQ